jgi:conjugation system TraG family ATPase
MINTAKITTFESVFPLLAIEEDCIISKQGDVTVAFKVQLPNVFSVGADEYEIIHSYWLRAIHALPAYTIVHKQDWMIKQTYDPKLNDDSSSFLTERFELHFNERSFFDHTCYLFITQTSQKQMRKTSMSTSLVRGGIISKEILSPTRKKAFLDAITQFQTIMDGSNFIKLMRLTKEELTADNGIIQQHQSLHQEDQILKDFAIDEGRMRIGDDELCLHTLSELDALPNFISTESKFSKMSTDKSDCMLSFASPVTILLPHNHMYNQYIFIEDDADIKKMLEGRAKKMRSLGAFSRHNGINEDFIHDFLNTAAENSLTMCYAHYNVISWSNNPIELERIKSEAGAQLAEMNCRARYNTVDLPSLYMASMPGNAGDFPCEERFLTFPELALCLYSGETLSDDSPSLFGIKLVDPLSGRPVHVDISECFMKNHQINNRNKIVIGPSGSGKSFLMNSMMRQYYEQQSHVVIVDMGNSYQGLCQLIHNNTNGEDGVYHTYTDQDPISFNPFYTDDGVYSIEKTDTLQAIIMQIWKGEASYTKAEETLIREGIEKYIKKVKEGLVKPRFNTFFEFIRDDFIPNDVKSAKVTKGNFDTVDLMVVLKPYYKGGTYDYLLNSESEVDLLNKRFVVFEIDAIKDNKVLFPIVTLIIMETYLNKIRRLKGIRKILVLEEAWKAIANEGMATYVKYLVKTIRKHFGELIIVSQELDDIISSPLVREAIVANSDCKILLDQRKNLNKLGPLVECLGLSEKQRAQIHTIGNVLDPDRDCKQALFVVGSGALSKVYDIEVSAEEYYLYTTEEQEKLTLTELVKANNGNLELSLKQLADKKRALKRSKTKEKK